MLSHQYRKKKTKMPSPGKIRQANATVHRTSFFLRSMHSNDETVYHANSITQFVKNQYFFTKISTVRQFFIIKFFTIDSALRRALNSSPIFAL